MVCEPAKYNQGSRRKGAGGRPGWGGKESGVFPLFSVRCGLVDLSPGVVTLFSWSLNRARNTRRINCVYNEVDPRGHFWYYCNGLPLDVVAYLILPL